MSVRRTWMPRASARCRALTKLTPARPTTAASTPTSALAASGRQRLGGAAEPLGEVEEGAQPPHLLAADRRGVHGAGEVPLEERGPDGLGDLDRHVLLRL